MQMMKMVMLMRRGQSWGCRVSPPPPRSPSELAGRERLGTLPRESDVLAQREGIMAGQLRGALIFLAAQFGGTFPRVPAGGVEHRGPRPGPSDVRHTSIDRNGWRSAGSKGGASSSDELGASLSSSSSAGREGTRAGSEPGQNGFPRPQVQHPAAGQQSGV